MVKNPPAIQETWFQSLGWEDPLEKGMATHSGILAWRILMDGGVWWATVHGMAESDMTEQLCTTQQHDTGRYFTLSVVFSITLLWTTCSLEDVLFKTNFYWNLVDLQRCVSFQVFHVQMPLLGGYSTWLTSHWTDTRHLLFWLKQICKSKCILLLTVLFYHYQKKKGHPIDIYTLLYIM